MSPELFKEAIYEAARDAGRMLRQVEFKTQAPDHPILWTDNEESYYLKFFIFQVIYKTVTKCHDFIFIIYFS